MTQLLVPDTIVSFNAKVGRGGPAMVQSVREILDDNPHTDVLCFQESQGYVDDLRKHFSPGWNLYVHDGWEESQQNPMMVRKHEGFPKREYGAGWGTVRNHTHWEGPKHGLDHAGRTWTWVKVGRVYVMCLHRATGGDGKNKPAYLEEAKRLTRFMERGEKAKHPRERHIIVIGDTNTSWKATHDGSMRDIRAEVEGRLIGDSKDPGVDYALTTRNINAIVRRTEHYGSDHRAAVMRRIELV